MKKGKRKKVKAFIYSVEKKGFRFSIWIAFAALAGKMALLCLKKGLQSLI